MHPFGHRPELSACFHRVHKYREGLGEEGYVRRLPADIRDELAFASLLLGLAKANVRWPVSTLVYCSDATESSTAVVSASFSRELAFRMYQGCEYQGKHVPFGASAVFNLGDTDIPDNHVCEEIVRC